MPLNIEQVVVTPEIAEQYLKLNTGNFRPIDSSRVDRYASDMLNGNWEFAGDPIRFSETILIDGQHRLRAVVKSGVSLAFVVIRGMSESSALSIDKGKSRSTTDWLRHAGYKNGKMVASIARLCLLHERGYWGHVAFMSGYCSDTDVVDFVEKHDENLQNACKIANHCRNLISVPISGAVALISSKYGNPYDYETVRWFFHGLSTGEDLKRTDPVLHLRNRMIDVPSAKRDHNYMQRMLMSIAWNKTASNEEMRVLKYILTGPSSQDSIKEIKLTPELSQSRIGRTNGENR